MSLERGILGFLSLKPLSGYDIKKLFDMSAAFFWPADQAQIYRSLKNLEDEGLIEIQGYEQDAGPSKKLYSITEKGRVDLRDWLLNPQLSDFITRSPFLVQLFFSGVLSRDELIDFIDAQYARNNALLEQLRDNYVENKKTFLQVSGIQKDARQYLTAMWTHRWGILNCEAYNMILKEMKADIQVRTDIQAES